MCLCVRVCLRAWSHVYARALTETFIHPRFTHQAYYGALIDGVDVVHITDADAKHGDPAEAPGGAAPGGAATGGAATGGAGAAAHRGTGVRPREAAPGRATGDSAGATPKATAHRGTGVGPRGAAHAEARVSCAPRGGGRNRR